MLLLVCNGSLFVPHLKMLFGRMGVAFIVRKPHEDLSSLQGITGVVLSGGPGSPDAYPHAWEKVMDMGVPVLGICMGHELIACMHGARVSKVERQERLTALRLVTADAIFEGLEDGCEMVKLHEYAVESLPEGFTLLASSRECHIEAMRHAHRPIYSFQGHPELAGEQGMVILRNFLGMCNLA